MIASREEQDALRLTRDDRRESLGEILGYREAQATGEEPKHLPHAHPASRQRQNVSHRRIRGPHLSQDELRRDDQIAPRDPRLSRRLRRRQQILDRASKLSRDCEHRPVISLKEATVVYVSEA